MQVWEELLFGDRLVAVLLDPLCQPFLNLALPLLDVCFALLSQGNTDVHRARNHFDPVEIGYQPAKFIEVLGSER